MLSPSLLLYLVLLYVLLSMLLSMLLYLYPLRACIPVEPVPVTVLQCLLLYLFLYLLLYLILYLWRAAIDRVCLCSMQYAVPVTVVCHCTLYTVTVAVTVPCVTVLVTVPVPVTVPLLYPLPTTCMHTIVPVEGLEFSTASFLQCYRI